MTHKARSGPMDEVAYQRGRRKRDELFGPGAGASVSYLEELAPELERIVMENLFGGLFCRTELDPKIRSLCTVAVLAALGGRDGQVRYHIKGALSVGCSNQEIVEVLTHLLFYAGLPSASNGLRIAKEVFSEKGAA